MKIFQFVCVFSLMLYSCKGGINSSSQLSFETIDCQFSPSMSLKMSDFAASIELLPLETVDQSLIGMLSKLKVYEGNYYIGSSSGRTDKIIIFNKDGKFLSKLDKRGMGPDEYVDIQDYVMLDKDKIAMVCYNTSRLYVYSLQEDSCLLTKKLKQYPLAIVLNQNKFTTFSNGRLSDGKSMLSLSGLIDDYDKKGNWLRSYGELGQEARNKMRGTHPLKTFSECEEKIYLKYSYCDTLFEVNGTELVPVFYVDFGEKKIPAGAFKDANDGLESVTKIVENNNGVGNIIFYEVTPSWLFFTFNDAKDKPYLAFYNRKSHQTMLGNVLVDDLLFPGNTIKFNFAPKCFTGDYLIWNMEPTKLKKIYTQYKNRVSADEFKKFESQHKQIVSICENLQEEDNPVLLKIKMKNP